jgi:hypothetical protein
MFKAGLRSKTVEIPRGGGAMPETVEGSRVHATILGQRVRMAFKPKRSGWARMELDFKRGTPNGRRV